VNRFKLQKGFTLIEVLVTIGLISVVFIMHYTLINSNTNALSARYKDLALRICISKMESLRALGYSGLPVSGSFSDSLLSSLPAGTGALAVSDYNSQIKHIGVTVSWTDPTFGPRSVALDTLISQNGGI
jgi:prepilin-type N-terminal cleavage/methylation domain-containing protein